MAWRFAVLDRAAQNIVSEASVLLKLDKPLHFTMKHRTVLNGILGGSGVAYTLSQDHYGQAVLAWIMPGAYAGYHLFQNREALRKALIKVPM